MSEKRIDGVLPCYEADNCPMRNYCGTDWDWKQPNCKKLVCLCKHIERLGYELYKRDEPHNTVKAAEYAYQMAWIMHNELKSCVDLLMKWEEPKANTQNFFTVCNIFKRFCENNEINFLKEAQQQMRMCEAVLSGNLP